MGRLPRFDAPGAIHHVFTAGAGPCPIFLDADDRSIFFEIARRAFARHGIRCLACCLMTTHYHAILQSDDGDLSAALERLNGGYARTFNRAHGRSGHLFGALFGGDEHLRAFVEDGLALRAAA